MTKVTRRRLFFEEGSSVEFGSRPPRGRGVHLQLQYEDDFAWGLEDRKQTNNRVMAADLGQHVHFALDVRSSDSSARSRVAPFPDELGRELLSSRLAYHSSDHGELPAEIDG